MGGDDLDGDEFLLTKQVVAAPGGESDGDDDGSEQKSENDLNGRTSKKRKKQHNDNDVAAKDEPPNKKLLHASRGVLEMSPKEQAAFLSANLAHYTRMSLSSTTTHDDTDDDKKTNNSVHVSYLATPQSKASNTSVAGSPNAKVAKQHSFVERLLSVCSRKRIKSHKIKGSASVLIICQSARRAVAILKDCVSLKTLAAKLFPKNATLSQHCKECTQSTFGLAVGTPHRLWALLDKGALTLEETQLVVLDAATCAKNYTVFTLPDTAEHCMKLIHDFVLPELSQRKTLKLAFC